MVLDSGVTAGLEGTCTVGVRVCCPRLEALYARKLFFREGGLDGDLDLVEGAGLAHDDTGLVRVGSGDDPDRFADFRLPREIGFDASVVSLLSEK